MFPDASTVAIEVLLLLHVPPATVISILLPTFTSDGPERPAGAALTVIVFVTVALPQLLATV
jgi:hypothetical protein